MRYIVSVLLILISGYALCGQTSDNKTNKRQFQLTFNEVVDIAKNQSPQAIEAKHSFRASYWQFVSYKANFLPSLILSANAPSFNRSIELQRQDDGTYRDTEVYENEITGSLSVEQNIAFTGGKLSLGSNLTRRDQFGDFKRTQYVSSPLQIRYTQSIFGINQLKWEKKIEPLKYEEAKRKYLKAVENVSINAIRYFFDLANAQQNLATAEFNYANNDTLFRIANGRYNIGTIGENDLLQSELNYMNSRATLNETKLSLESAKNRLRSFLGYNENADIEIIIPEQVPAIEVELDKIMQLSRQSNPDLLAYQRQLIEAEKNVASEKAARGFTADLDLSFGLNQSGGNLSDAYNSPKDRETVSLRLRVPILDWGQGKGRVRMAQSNQELVRIQIEQAEADFEQNVVLNVNQFNMQGEQFNITSKADTIARNRYNVSMQRYLIGKITITDMNNAQNDRDNARQRYVAGLRNYWNYYYQLRQLTLFDLINNKPLEVDYELMID